MYVLGIKVCQCYLGNVQHWLRQRSGDLLRPFEYNIGNHMIYLSTTPRHNSSTRQLGLQITNTASNGTELAISRAARVHRSAKKVLGSVTKAPTSVPMMV
ncbi:hypothetical protein J6590_005823 [Homalodisca vitripennis]|nr:hypothetical protein J6590_005823 [Homalodisca vitripennis]